MPSDYQNDTGSDRVQLTKRQFLGAAVGAGVLGATPVAGRAAADDGDGGGDGGGGSGGGGGGGSGFGGDGGDYPVRRYTVTLISGQTIVVTERETTFDGEDGEVTEADEGVERSYTVVGGDHERLQVLEEPAGTYVVPDGVDLDRLDRELFNVDYLVDNGYTDEETDAIPVVARFADGGGGGARALDADATELESIGAVAAGIPKDRARATDVDSLTADVEKIHLDRKYEALLDESAARIGAPTAREEFGVDGTGVRVAILDTGIDADHPDVGDRVVHEANYSTDDTADDLQGHGTHVAGIAAGDGTESDGQYVGVAPGADLMNVKVLNRAGVGSLSGIVLGIEDAVANDADVINMSLGGPTSEDDPLVDAVNVARDEGVTVVAAAGNEFFSADFRSVGSPATAAGAIAVSASDDDRDATFAGARGPAPHTFLVKPEVSAPGVGVTAAGSDDAGEFPYTDKTGTSMSSPHVAGLSALLLEAEPELDPDGVEDRLVSTADFAAGRDVYKQGGGEVDAVAALDADLLVHDAVANFGLYEEAATETAEFAVENVGDEERTVDVSATLRNELEGEPLDDHATVEPGEVTVAPGERETVTLTVDTGDAFGMNAGVVTFETAAATYRAVFGFTRGLELTVEKTPHEARATVAGDYGQLFAHDGSVSVSAFSAFGADGTWSPLLFQEEATVTVWSAGDLPADEERGQTLGGDPVLSVTSGVHVGPDDDRVTVDETEAVPRTVDTSAVADGPTHEAFDDITFSAGLYGLPEGGSLSYSRTFLGNFNVFRGFFTPVDADEPTNVKTEWQFYPAHDREAPWDVGDAYALLEPARSVPAGGEAVEVSPDALAAEAFTYHRETGDQQFRVANHLWPVDDESFPSLISFATVAGIGRDREEQTWWRTPEIARYDESWRDGDSFGDRNWLADRAAAFVADDAGRSAAAFNRHPLAQNVSNTYGTVVNPANIYQNVSLADQAPEPFAFAGIEDVSGGYRVLHDGEVIDEDPDAGPAPVIFTDPIPDLDDGDEVVVQHDAWDHSRSPDPGVGFRADYVIEYADGNANRTPVVDRLAVPGLASNELPTGQTVVWVQLDPAQTLEEESFMTEDPPEEIVDVAAYYADGALDHAPWEDAAGWTEAEVVYRDEDAHLLGVRVDAFEEAMHLAVVASNEEGQTVRSATINAVGLDAWTEATWPVDVRPDEVDADSNQTVPVAIEPTDGFDPQSDVAVDTLRFGAPEAVHAGEGAEPERVRELGNGTLLVQFPAADAGYESDRAPAVALVAGSTHDGTPHSGADAVEAVVVGQRAAATAD